MATNCASGVQWTNYGRTESLTPFSLCKPESLDDLILIVQEAEGSGKHVHAVGSGWSFSDCAITGDYMVDMTALTRPLQTVQQALLPDASPLIYHVEAGITINSLYTRLAQTVDPVTGGALALETQGGSSGQTLVGAVSTGTHGGDHFLAPIADSVLAIHLVGRGGTEYWIEPSSGITDPGQLTAVLPDIDPANIIYDDSLFDAALVSLGCMGLIYAVVLRVRHAFGLREITTQQTWRHFVRTAYQVLNSPQDRFLQVVLDPYFDSEGDNTCLVTKRAEIADLASTDSPPQPNVLAPLVAMGADLIANAPLQFVGALTQFIQDLIVTPSPTASQLMVDMINAVLQQGADLRKVLTADYGAVMLGGWPPSVWSGPSWLVMDTTYRGASLSSGSSQPDNAGWSIEMNFPATDPDHEGHLPFVDFVDAALELINSQTSTFLAGYVALRFSGPTRACLGMQQWPQTCSVEISVLQRVQGEFELIKQLLDLMYQYGGLPHWGQMLDLPGGVQGNGAMYRRYLEWRRAYARLSDNFTTRTFENPLSLRWWLTTPDPYTPGSKGWVSLGGVLASPPAVSVNQDGRLEIFGLGTDSTLYHMWQTQSGNPGSWTTWAQLSANQNVGTPSIAARTDGRMELFARSGDSSLWHIWQNSPNGGWSAGDGMGGSFSTDPAAASNADGHLEVFAVGATSRDCQHRWDDPTVGWLPPFGNWDSLHGTVIAQPAAGLNDDGTLRVFVVGTDMHVYTKTQTTPGGSWTQTWEQLPLMLSGPPTVIQLPTAAGPRLMVLGATPDQLVGMIIQTTASASGGWSIVYEQEASYSTGMRQVAVTRQGSAFLVFSRSGGQSVQYSVIEDPNNPSSWSGWTDLGGIAITDPIAATNADGRVEVFVVGTDGALYHRWQVVPTPTSDWD